jgi:hypothetical protein
MLLNGEVDRLRVSVGSVLELKGLAVSPRMNLGLLVKVIALVCLSTFGSRWR